MSRLEAFVILNENGTLSTTWLRPFQVQPLYQLFSLPGLGSKFAGTDFQSSEHRNSLASKLCISAGELFGAIVVGRIEKDGLLHGLKVPEIRRLIVSLDYVWDENSGTYAPMT